MSAILNQNYETRYSPLAFSKFVGTIAEIFKTGNAHIFTMKMTLSKEGRIF